MNGEGGKLMPSSAQQCGQLARSPVGPRTAHLDDPGRYDFRRPSRTVQRAPVQAFNTGYPLLVKPLFSQIPRRTAHLIFGKARSPPTRTANSARRCGMSICFQAAPPSLELCRWSNGNTTGCWYKSLNNKRCVEVESGKRMTFPKL
jgi:hypothetical protein